MGLELSDHVILCKVRLAGGWIKRREVVNGARRIRSEKLREHQYRGYAMSLEIERVNEIRKVMSIICGRRRNWQWLAVQERCISQREWGK